MCEQCSPDYPGRMSRLERAEEAGFSYDHNERFWAAPPVNPAMQEIIKAAFEEVQRLQAEQRARDAAL